MFPNLLMNRSEETDSDFVFVDDGAKTIRAVRMDQDGDLSPASSRLNSPRPSHSRQLPFKVLLDRIHDSRPVVEERLSRIYKQVHELTSPYYIRGCEIAFALAEEAEKCLQENKINLRVAVGISVVTWISFVCMVFSVARLSSQPLTVYEDPFDLSIHGKVKNGLVKPVSVPDYQIARVEQRIEELLMDNSSLQADNVVSAILRSRDLQFISNMRTKFQDQRPARNSTFHTFSCRADGTEFIARNWSGVTCSHSGHTHTLNLNNLPPVEWKNLNIARMANKWKRQDSFEDRIRHFMNVDGVREVSRSEKWKVAPSATPDWATLHANMPPRAARHQDMNYVYGSPQNWQKLNREMPREMWREGLAFRNPSSTHPKPSVPSFTHPSMPTNTTHHFKKMNFDELSERVKQFALKQQINNSTVPQMQPDAIKRLHFHTEILNQKKMREEFQGEKPLRRRRELMNEAGMNEQEQKWREMFDKSMKEFSEKVEKNKRERKEHLSSLSSAPAGKVEESARPTDWKNALEMARNDYLNQRFMADVSSDDAKILDMKKRRLDGHFQTLVGEVQKEREGKQPIEKRPSVTANEWRKWSFSAPGPVKSSDISHIEKMQRLKMDRETQKKERAEIEKKAAEFRVQMHRLHDEQVGEREKKAARMDEFKAQMERLREAHMEAEKKRIEGQGVRDNLERFSEEKRETSQTISRSEFDSQMNKLKSLDDSLDAHVEKLKMLKLEVEMQKWKKDRFELQAQRLRELHDGYPATFQPEKNFEILYGDYWKKEKNVAVSYGPKAEESLISELSWRRKNNRSFADAEDTKENSKKLEKFQREEMDKFMRERLNH